MPKTICLIFNIKKKKKKKKNLELVSINSSRYVLNPSLYLNRFRLMDDSIIK